MTRGLTALAVALLSFAGTHPAHAANGAPATPSDLGAAAKQVDVLLDAWQFKEAAAALATLKSAAPGAPETNFLDGYQKFLAGDYDGAVHALSAASDAQPANGEIKSLKELAAAARDAIKDFREERSSHAVIHYAPEDAALVPYARDTVEAAYAALHADLGFEIAQPIRVEFYRAPSDLAAVSSLSVAEVSRTGTIALCKWARLMVTTPRALAYGYPWLDSMNHELVHYAVSTLSKDRAPVWFQEGLAKFLERRWREPAGGRIPPPMEHLLAKALRSGHLISFEAMHPSMAKLPSAEDATLAFAEVENAIAYLYEKGGMAALRDAIKRVGDGEDARQAVAAAAGGGWPEFERGWRAFMLAQHYKTFPAIDIADHPHPQAERHRLRAQAGRGGRAVAGPQGERALSLPAARQHAARPGSPARGGRRVREGAEGGHLRRPQRPVGDLDLPREAGANLPDARRARARAQGAGPGAGGLPRAPLAEPHRRGGAAGAGRRAGRRHRAARVAGDQPIRPARPLRARHGVRKAAGRRAGDRGRDRARAAAL